MIVSRQVRRAAERREKALRLSAEKREQRKLKNRQTVRAQSAREKSGDRFIPVTSLVGKDRNCIGWFHRGRFV